MIEKHGNTYILRRVSLEGLFVLCAGIDSFVCAHGDVVSPRFVFIFFCSLGYVTTILSGAYTTCDPRGFGVSPFSDRMFMSV